MIRVQIRILYSFCFFRLLYYLYFVDVSNMLYRNYPYYFKRFYSYLPTPVIYPRNNGYRVCFYCENIAICLWSNSTRGSFKVETFWWARVYSVCYDFSYYVFDFKINPPEKRKEYESHTHTHILFRKQKKKWLSFLILISIYLLYKHK